MEMQVNPYGQVFIDITGKCNAQCKFCERGARRGGLLPALPARESHSNFMPPERFEKILHHLLDSKIIHPWTTLALYNWGEPLIHPQFPEIMRIIKDAKDFKGTVVISSNGGKKTDFSRDFMPDTRTQFVFTLQGFSRESYSRGNGFDFDKIRNNISEMIDSLHAISIHDISLTYLIYKYNHHELQAAKRFAEKKGVQLDTTVAYFNSLNLFMKYVEDEFNDEEKKLVNSSLILEPFDFIRSLRPAGYVCPQFSYLPIDADGKMNLGCCSRLDAEEDVYGDICSMTLEDTYTLRKNQAICTKCAGYSLDYFINEAPKHGRQLLRNII